MSTLSRLARGLVVCPSSSKEALARLTTAAGVSRGSQAVAGQKPPASLSARGPMDATGSGSAGLPSFTSFSAMLHASGGTGDAVYKRLAELSREAYNAEKEAVDAQLRPVLTQNKLVLFMEGTVDNPKSTLSMNVVKMLTQLQSLPLIAVDVTTHPAILGFALTHGKKDRCPLLFVDGVCLGSHDNLLQLYQNGALAKQIAGKLPSTSSCFAGELPIALY
ncbi:hypothetical protein Efla_007084 [Eimeria flavescens]